MSDVPVADLVLRNAKVATFTASQPRAESIAVKDGRVLGLGAFAVPSAMGGAPDTEEEIQGTAAMMAAFAGHGLTGVVDGGGMATSPRDYDALYELWRRGGLTLRTRLFMCTWTPGCEVGDYEQLTTVGQPDFGDAMLKVSGAGEMPHSGCHDFGGLDAEFSISDASYDELLQITRLCARHGGGYRSTPCSTPPCRACSTRGSRSSGRPAGSPSCAAPSSTPTAPLKLTSHGWRRCGPGCSCRAACCLRGPTTSAPGDRKPRTRRRASASCGSSASRLAAARTAPGRTGIRPGHRSGGWPPAAPSTARPDGTRVTG